MNHTISDLRQMQSMPLPVKVAMTQNRIQEWVEKFGLDGVYISFSGGKDSTVLLDIARKLYPDIQAVFVDTGLEYPEVRNFVKTYDNVVWLKPKKNFRQVIEEYGYPFISKEVSDKVQGARRYAKAVREKKQDEAVPKETIRYQQIMGKFLNKDGEPSIFNMAKYKFFLEAPFEISANCCNIMKKSPAHSYSHKTGRKPITAQMADESKIRASLWLRNGCNGFQMKSPISNPMSFWTEQDVLLYIKQLHLPIAPVYGEIIEIEDKQALVKDTDAKDLPNMDYPLLRTTGCSRTGCMFCGYGCHLEKPGGGRFLKMKYTHPKQYDYIMKPKEEGGLGYKDVIDWINEHGGFHIEY